MHDAISDLFCTDSPDLIALCTNSRQTWWRWKTGRTDPPVSVVNLLRIVIFGELSHIADGWTGWRFYRGQLYDPAGYAHTPATIETWWWTRQRLDAMRARENQQSQTLPPNATELPSARPAHALGDDIDRRLRADK